MHGHATRITRRPGMPEIDGIRAATLDGLLAALAARGITGPVVTDLSLGEWRSHELARSCFEQLELDWPLPAAPEQAGPPPSWDDPNAASTIGDWIDAEGRGDAAARAALMLAEELLCRLPERTLSLVVLAPRFGIAWQPDSAVFLRCLAYGRRPGDRLILVADESADPSGCAGITVNWSDAPSDAARPRPPGLAALVPTTLDPETGHALGASGHTLRAGFVLVPPEWRRSPASTPRLEFDRLAAAAVPSWLRAFAQVYGNNLFVDAWFLCAQANRRLAEGGHGIALRLMERAAACAKTQEDRAVLNALAQGYRIALMRYEEAIAAPDPSPALPPLLRGAQLMTKGWGLVMTGQAQLAQPYMQGAREALGPILGHNRQFLYLLNISALNLVNLGDLDGALKIEKEIEAVSAALPDHDYRLEYVNSINIARLYRRHNQLDLAAEYYERAFATTEGARTESDLVYTNVCMARLDGARGRALDAFHAWLRASLHWLASDVPEAIGWRVLSAILGRKAVPASTPTEQVAGALAGLLAASAEAAGIGLSPAPQRAPAFVRADRVHGAAAEALGAPGFSVLVTREPFSSALAGPCHDALAALVAGLASAAAGAPEIANAPAILVDDGFGREMATTREGLIATCLRLSIGRARFTGDSVPIPAVCRLGVRLGPAVSRVEFSGEEGLVHFKRYLPPRLLSGAEAAVVRGEIPDPFPAGFSAFVRRLEAARVVEVTPEGV